MKYLLASGQTAHFACSREGDSMQLSQTIVATDNRTVRAAMEDDVPMIAEWWAYQRKDEFYPGLLSSLGLVVESDIPEAAGWLYETNSRRCFADYCVVNPALPKGARGLAIEALMDGLIGLASARGFMVIEITIRNPSLIKRCKAKGFIELGQVKYMGRRLWAVS